MNNIQGFFKNVYNQNQNDNEIEAFESKQLTNNLNSKDIKKIKDIDKILSNNIINIIKNISVLDFVNDWKLILKEKLGDYVTITLNELDMKKSLEIINIILLILVSSAENTVTKNADLKNEINKELKGIFGKDIDYFSELPELMEQNIIQQIKEKKDSYILNISTSLLSIILASVPVPGLGPGVAKIYDKTLDGISGVLKL
jgi:hypothetical protein